MFVFAQSNQYAITFCVILLLTNSIKGIFMSSNLYHVFREIFFFRIANKIASIDFYKSEFRVIRPSIELKRQELPF